LYGKLGSINFCHTGILGMDDDTEKDFGDALIQTWFTTFKTSLEDWLSSCHLEDNSSLDDFIQHSKVSQSTIKVMYTSQIC
jgi:hypothetical protein